MNGGFKEPVVHEKETIGFAILSDNFFKMPSVDTQFAFKAFFYHLQTEKKPDTRDFLIS
jgi:hypothetical protein